MKINTTDLRSFFYGTLLGDSYIHNGSFYSKQTSEDLVRWKGKIIEQNLPDAKIHINEYDAYVDKKGVKHQKYWVLSASGSAYIHKLDNLFYPEGKKILPAGIIKQLTPIGLAVWYADDGTTILVGLNNATGSAKNRRVQFCTDSFSKAELDNAVKEFETLGYHPSLLQRKTDVYRLQILGFERQNFLIQIYPYFMRYFPSLSYKMDLGYRNTSLGNTRYLLPEYKKMYLEISAHPQFRNRLNRG